MIGSRTLATFSSALTYFDSAADLLIRWEPRTQEEAHHKLTAEVQLSLCREALVRGMADLLRPQPEREAPVLALVSNQDEPA